MSSEIRLWKIEDETPKLIERTGLNLEDRLEGWIAQDIGMVNDNLLVIGRQVRTAYGGKIDLLAIDPEGSLVILELKRDRTPRNIVAQTLDYASWVQDLEYEDIEEIAGNFLGDDRTLGQAFKENFDADLPEIVNISHRMYIVASALDPATERIVEYLSETHGVDINIATFAYFKTSTGEELIGRSFLLDEQEVQRRSQFRRRSKQPSPRSLEELQVLAEENGKGDLWDKAREHLWPLFDHTQLNRESVGLRGRVNGSMRGTLAIYCQGAYIDRGLPIAIYPNFLEYFGISKEELRTALESIGQLGRPDGIPERTIHEFYWFNDQSLDKLIEFLRGAKERMN